MSEYTTNRPADRFEADLRSLARAVEWPPTPDLRAAVRARIAATTVSRRRTWWPAWLRLTRPLLIAIVLLALLAAVVAAVILGLPGLRISVVDVLPTPNVPAASNRAPTVGSSTTTGSLAPSLAPSRAPGANLELGQSVTLAEASAALGSPVLLPELPGRAGPDAVYLDRLDDVPMVTLIWRAGPDLPPPTASSDVGLLVTQFEARIDQRLLTKLVSQGTRIEQVAVNDHIALWISGNPHVVWFQRPNGDVVQSVLRLVGDTLAIDWDGRIVRLESALGRERSIELAESFR